MYPFFFFFQAEDGIRDSSVTGVQTCALPISTARLRARIQVACSSPQASVSLTIMVVAEPRTGRQPEDSGHCGIDVQPEQCRPHLRLRSRSPQDITTTFT